MWTSIVDKKLHQFVFPLIEISVPFSLYPCQHLLLPVLLFIVILAIHAGIRWNLKKKSCLIKPIKNEKEEKSCTIGKDAEKPCTIGKDAEKSCTIGKDVEKSCTIVKKKALQPLITKPQSLWWIIFTINVTRFRVASETPTQWVSESTSRKVELKMKDVPRTWAELSHG